jgi:hypothetical protein
MISVRKLVGDERKYCTHCDDRALYVLNFTNPRIVQQGSSGALCNRCMGLLKRAAEKATAPALKTKRESSRTQKIKGGQAK